MTGSHIAFYAIAAVLVFWAVGAYNRLVSLRNAFFQIYGQLDLQLRQRYELVPGIVALAGRYLEHERGALEALTAARHQAQVAADRAKIRIGRPGELASMALAEQVFNGAVRKIVGLVENYPELQSEPRMRELIDELAIGENKIIFSTQLFNEAVTAFNEAARQFPTNIVATIFGFPRAGRMAVASAEVERLAPRVPR